MNTLLHIAEWCNRNITDSCSEDYECKSHLCYQKPQASIEAREVKYCIQGDALAMADDKIQRGGIYADIAQ